MVLDWLDWTGIILFFSITMLLGLAAVRRAGRNTSEYFLAGRRMPWWLLGFSMVATTFSTDTPNLVTDMVRQNGVAGNWAWWAFLLTGMLTVFIYARLWRRSNVTTDMEFYELRYSGRAAAFLRGFRALYLGVFFNVCIMATVTLAAIKIGGVMFNFSPVRSVLLASVATVLFSMAGGLTAVIFTDFLLFLVAMGGAVAAASAALKRPEVGGLNGLLSSPALGEKLSLIPPLYGADGQINWDLLIPLLIMPLAVQWWSVWYPGAEPGGGGYIAQRMLAAKDERHAVGATFFFNLAHYAIRPWPWIVVALASLIVFPDLASISAAFPHIPASKVGHDLAYPAMLTFLPHGVLGLVVASLMAAYMSTISTHLNWGSSYIVNDFWKRFVRPHAGERELVWVGRVSTALLMVLAGVLALTLENALGAFQILLQIGAGTGLLFILRWFWWRINPCSELMAMAVSFAVALYTQFGAARTLPGWQQLLLGVAVTTIAWVTVTLVTPPSDAQTLRRFCALIRPGGAGWRKVIDDAAREGVTIECASRAHESIPRGILCMILGCVLVYSALFGTGMMIYGRTGNALLFIAGIIGSGFLLIRLLRRAQPERPVVRICQAAGQNDV